MKRERRRTSHTGDILLSLDPAEALEFRQALVSLRKHLVHKRDLLNGKDFLFSGPPEEIHAALARLVETEHVHSRGLQYNYTQIDDFFLLRVLGPRERQAEIEFYFEEAEE